MNIGVRIGPPPLRFERPPDVVIIPNSDAYIYMIPGTIGLYFYDGYWYRHYEDRCYRSRRYTGGWVHIKPYRVPRSVLEIPSDLPSRCIREGYSPLFEQASSNPRRRPLAGIIVPTSPGARFCAST